MHQKYAMVFSSNTNLVFIIVLKIAGFYIGFSSIFKIIFLNFLCAFKTVALKMLFTVESRMLTAMCLIITGLNSIFNEALETVEWGRA